MTSPLKGRSLLSLADLEPGEFRQILDTAASLKARLALGEMDGLRRLLAGRTMAMVFQKPSLRTRVSFEMALRTLGGGAIYLAPADIGLGQRERVEDVARVLGSYVDGIVARVFGQDILETMAAHAGVPVVNALSDAYHPCQAIADMLTLEELLGRLEGCRLTYLGDGNNVAHSLMNAAALTGVHLTICCPPGYEPDPAMTDQARRLAPGRDDWLTVSHDPQDAVAGADAIYTDVWASMGQEQEADQRRNHFEPYRIDQSLIEAARHPRPRRLRGRLLPLVLHCLPAHYGEEITEEVVAEHPEIFQQAANRMYGQIGLLAHLLH